MAILKVKDKDGNVIEIPAIAGPPGKDGEPGKDGKDGAVGKDGKSAYEYAKDGGYPGTEAEFAAKLAKEDSASNKANEIVESVTGTNAIITDSTNEPLRSLKLFGKSMQNEIKSNQLFDANIAVGELAIVEGGVITINADTNDCYLVGAYEGTIPYINLSPGSYTVSSNNPNVKVTMYIRINGVLRSFNTDSSPTVTLTNDTFVHGIRIRSVDEASLNGQSFTVMLNEGTTALPWEPYTGGIASPNPQYPQEITSVGDDGDLEVGVYGLNLLDVSNLTSDAENAITVNGTGISITSTTSAWYSYYTYSMSLKPNTQYTVAANVKAITDNTFRRIRVFDGDGVMLNSVHLTTDGRVKTTFTTNDGNVVIAFGVNNESGMQQIEYNDIILSIGFSDIPYEPYSKQSLTIPTPNGLPGINISGTTLTVLANYTDSEGRIWCCDEIDLERGKYIQRVLKAHPVKTIVFNTRQDNGRCNVFARPYPFGVRFASGSVPAMSTIATWSNWSNGNNGTFAVSADGVYYKDSTKTLEEVNAIFAELGTNFEVLGVLETPIETDLTEEQIAQYKALTTNYPNTTFISDAFTSVDYVADTKKYIDKKFVELASALV